MADQHPAESVLRSARAFYDRHQNDPAVRTTYGYFTNHPVAPLNRKRLHLLIDDVRHVSEELKRPLRILDVACGGGLITCAVALLGHRTLGIDLSEDEIRMAQSFAGEEKFDGMFMKTDVLADSGWQRKVEEILGGRPDVILLAYALHHLPGVEKFVQALARWLPASAVLLVNEENPESPLFRLKHRVRTWIQKDTEIEWHRTFSGWKDLLEKEGFQIRGPLQGADVLPGLSRVMPEKCWSLVFGARRS